MPKKPLIVDIKRNALDDGPGIRTLIFFKGCPLSCVWCQNPEAKTPLQEIAFYKENCGECRRCLEVCDEKAIDFSYKYRINRALCNLCGECVKVCPNEALKLVGKEYETRELVDIALKDRVFFKNSGGGVTLSGGEPLYHMNYVSELLKTLKKEGIHSCIETCGYYNRKAFNEMVSPYVDLIYFDLKIFDPELHEKYCKESNEIILTNFENLIKDRSVEVLPRIPLIPDITATDENLTEWANYLNSLNIRRIVLLPYNPLWISKPEKIGIKTQYPRSTWMSREEKARVKSVFSGFEFEDF
nr:glycyl-radical enzyme activating protein [Candidatus Njordarchaeum guaymaensis]